MMVVGLTGSIAMGKSETARMFRAEGVPVFDADAAVHRFYAPGGAAVPPILARFPGSGSAALGIDRQRLAQQVLGDADALRALEAIVHPLVRGAQTRFLEDARARGEALAVVDHPLLFETGAAHLMDVVVVVSAPAELQRQRAFEREGMTEEKFAAILARQLPDADKKARADFVVDSSTGLEDARRQVARIVRTLRQRRKDHA